MWALNVTAVFWGEREEAGVENLVFIFSFLK
jgi:hypothetical protein